MHLPEMQQPRTFPGRQNSQVQRLGVLTAPDPFPTAVPQATNDLLVRTSTGERLATAEDATLLLRDQLESLVHPPSIHRPGTAQTTGAHICG